MVVVGHNIDGMGEWTKNLDVQNLSYRDSIDEMYDIFASFYNSPEFKGALATLEEDIAEEQRSHYLAFSDDFEEASKVVNQKKVQIMDNESELEARAHANNPIIG